MGSGVSKNEALGNIHVLIIGGGYAGVQVIFVFVFFFSPSLSSFVLRQQQSF